MRIARAAARMCHRYVTYPNRIVANGPRVAVLGTTTGPHLGLSDDEEAKLRVIWTAEVSEGLLLE